MNLTQEKTENRCQDASHSVDVGSKHSKLGREEQTSGNTALRWN